MAQAFKCDHCGQLFEGKPVRYAEVEAHGFVLTLLPMRRLNPEEEFETVHMGPFPLRRPAAREEALELCEPCMRELSETAATHVLAGEITKYGPEQIVDADDVRLFQGLGD